MRTPDAGGSALSDAGVAFDLDSGEFTGPAGDARLAPQPTALLSLLVENAGEVVSRSAIKARLWPGGRVEFDQGIAFAIREIRKALEEVGADPGLVETLPRRGYRVAAAKGVGPVAAGPTASAPTHAAAAPAATAAGAPAPPGSAGWRAGVGGMLLGLVLGAALVTAGSGGHGRRAAVVAVFPHEPLDGTPRVESVSLAEALTVRLTAALEGVGGVVGPTGTAGLAGPNDAEGARASLNACLILSGSLRWMHSDSAVVFTQLVRTSDRVHVWARWDTLASRDLAGAVAGAVVEPVRTALADCEEA